MRKYLSLFFAAVSIFAFSAGGSCAVTDTPSVTAVSGASTHTISFDIVNSDTVAKVILVFFPGFGFGGASPETATGLSSGTLSIKGSNTIVYTVTHPVLVTAGTSCVLPIKNIVNASVCATTYTVTVITANSYDTVIDGPTVSDTFALRGNSLFITTPPQVVLSGDTSRAVEVIMADAAGNTDVLSCDTVTLGGSSPTGRFSSGLGSWTDTSIFLTAGSGRFYYSDTAVGMVTISVSRQGCSGYSQNFKIADSITIPCDTASTHVFLCSGMTVTIPAGTFSSTFVFAIDETPANAVITDANNSTAGDPSLQLVSDLSATIKEVSAFAVSASGIIDYSRPLNPDSGKFVTLAIDYPNIPAIAGVLEQGLRIFRLDEATRGWVLPSGAQRVDAILKNVSVDLSSFSVYRIISLGVKSSLASVIVFPNPFMMSSARDGNLKFVNLPVQATIRIYNVAGELVRKIEKNDTANRALWDGKNGAGEKVASGVYFYIISSAQDANKITGKIAVISN